MTTFVHCRGCATQIHETAISCPKCGAPQNIAAAPSTPTHKPAPKDFSDYAQVPWFRKRWFVICCLLIITPVAGIIAATGDLYYSQKGEVKVFPKSAKIVFILLSVIWVIGTLAKK